MEEWERVCVGGWVEGKGGGGRCQFAKEVLTQEIALSLLLRQLKDNTATPKRAIFPSMFFLCTLFHIQNKAVNNLSTMNK